MSVLWIRKLLLESDHVVMYVMDSISYLVGGQPQTWNIVDSL